MSRDIYISVQYSHSIYISAQVWTRRRQCLALFPSEEHSCLAIWFHTEGAVNSVYLCLISKHTDQFLGANCLLWRLYAHLRPFFICLFNDAHKYFQLAKSIIRHPLECWSALAEIWQAHGAIRSQRWYQNAIVPARFQGRWTQCTLTITRTLAFI